MRREYELTTKQLNVILKACDPVPMVALQCGTPPSAQANVDAAWRRLGDELGFDSLTVRPVHDRGQRFFTAEEKSADA